MYGEDTRFKEGNKAAQKNPKVVIRKFREMLENAKNNEDVLSFQDACASINWRDSKCNYWASKLPVFATLKKDIQDTIVRRINKKTLKGDYNPTASIWRMKQLGEKDTQHQEINSVVKSTNVISLGSGKKPE